MDNTFYKFIMTLEEKTNQINAIQKMIVDLKTNPSLKSKNTIQKLQQQIDEIVNIWIII